MFSGQGSQHFQMGRALFDGEPVFRDCMLQLDGLVRELSRRSVIDTLYSDGQPKSALFDRTAVTHPAIFMVEYALAQSLIHAGVVPDIALGASLGSFAAAAVAGIVGVEDALAAVIRQATAFEETCKPGGMLAVLADPMLYDEDFLSTKTEMAGVNFSSHFVVSAQQAQFPAIEACLREREVTYQRLPVSFAFHSQWIDEARAPFESATRCMRYRAGELPLMRCDEATMAADLPDNYFWSVVRKPIRFREAISQLEREGPHRYIDVGPSSTLATFLKYGLPAASISKVHPILTPYGQDGRNLAAVLASSRH